MMLSGLRSSYPVVLKTLKVVLAFALLSAFCTSPAQGRPDVKWETGLDPYPTCVAAIKNQDTVAVGGATGTVKIMNFWTWTVAQSIHAFNAALYSIAVSPDGSTLVALGVDSFPGTLTIRAFSLASGKSTWSITTSGFTGALSFSPNSEEILYAGSSNLLIQTNNGAVISKNVLGAAVIAPDGSIWSAYGDNNWQIVNAYLPNGQVTVSQTFYSSNNSSSPTGLTTVAGTSVLGVSSLGWLALWDPCDQRVNYLREDFSSAGYSVPNNRSVPAATCFTNDGTGLYLAYWTSNNAVETDFCASPGGCKTSYYSFYSSPVPESPSALAFAPNDPGLFVVYPLGLRGALEEVALEPTSASTQQGQDYQRTVGRGPITGTAWSPDGTLVASAGLDGWIDISSTADGSVPYLIATTAKVTGLAFTPDGKSLISASGKGWDTNGAPGAGLVTVWDIATQNTTQTISSDANAIAVSPDGQTLAAGDDTNVELFSLSTGSTLKQLNGASEVCPTHSIAFSNDGTQLAIGGGAGSNQPGVVKVWNVSSGKEIYSNNNVHWAVTAISFSPDGTKLAYSCGDPQNQATQQANIISLPTGRQLSSFGVQVGTSVAISPDGETLVLGDDFWSIRCFNLQTGNPIALYNQSTDGGGGNFESGSFGLSFSPDGTLFSYGTGTGSVVVAKNDFWGAPTMATGLSVPSKTLTGGYSETATLTLAKAPLTAVTVPITSSGPITAPSSVIVQAGSATASFTVTANPQTTSGTATLSATLGAGSPTVAITVVRMTVAGLTISPTSLPGGPSEVAIAQVKLSSPAPPNGAVVSLSCSPAGVVTLPSTVTVPSGSTVASFSVQPSPVNAATSVVIGAQYGGAVSAKIVITSPILSSISCSPAAVLGGSPTTATISLASPAGSAGSQVSLSSSNSGVAAFASPTVTIQSGSSQGTVTVVTNPVGTDTKVTLTATFNGAKHTAIITIQAPRPASLSLNPTTVQGGASSTGTITLTGPAPTAGLAVSLTSSSGSALVPSSIRVPSGATSVTFTVKTKLVTAMTSATITASSGGVSQQAALTVTH